MSVPTTTKQFTLSKYGSYRNLVLGEAPVPKTRGSEVLVKIHATSLQYRDLMIANGYYPAKLLDNLVPLSDGAGEVVAVGEDVKGWKVGDRVCANFSLDHIYGATTEEIRDTSLGGQAHGVLTQYRNFPAHSLVAIPEHFSYEEAATLPCAALTAYNALYGSTQVKAGDYVLVLGTGGVSIWALQFAVAAGAIVIATSSSDEKLKLASKLGAKHVINYKQTPDWDQEVLKITGGVGVDFVIEVGGSGTLAKSINSTRIGSGVVAVIGHVSHESGDQSIVFPVIMRAATLRGINIGSVAQVAVKVNAVFLMFNDMNRLIKANPEVTKPVIDKVFPFEQAIDAYAYLESQKHVGKIVIKVD